MGLCIVYMAMARGAYFSWNFQDGDSCTFSQGFRRFSENYWNFLLVSRNVRYGFMYHHDDFPGTGRFTGTCSVNTPCPTGTDLYEYESVPSIMFWRRSPTVPDLQKRSLHTFVDQHDVHNLIMYRSVAYKKACRE